MKGRNGYAPSIMPAIYGGESEYTARHEVFGGANREISKANGFWLPVPPGIHEMIHQNAELSRTLKRLCQREYEKTHSREEFVKLIGKNYLED